MIQRSLLTKQKETRRQRKQTCGYQRGNGEGDKLEFAINIYMLLCITGGGHADSLQYSCLEIPLDRGAWQATVHGVAKSWT